MNQKIIADLKSILQHHNDIIYRLENRMSPIQFYNLLSRCINYNSMLKEVIEELEKEYKCDTSMEELLKEVGLLVSKELIEANKINGQTFVDKHQGYAVILEEVQETEEELDRVKQKLKFVWGATRRNEYPKEAIEMLNHYSKLLACEAIQTAAMAQKFIDSFKE